MLWIPFEIRWMPGVILCIPFVILCILYDTGLDEAILGSMNSCGDPEQDSKKIADLLKYGAHSLVSSLLASCNLKV